MIYCVQHGKTSINVIHKHYYWQSVVGTSTRDLTASHWRQTLQTERTGLYSAAVLHTACAGGIEWAFIQFQCRHDAAVVVV